MTFKLFPDHRPNKDWRPMCSVLFQSPMLRWGDRHPTLPQYIAESLASHMKDAHQISQNIQAQLTSSHTCARARALANMRRMVERIQNTGNKFLRQHVSKTYLGREGKKKKKKNSADAEQFGLPVPPQLQPQPTRTIMSTNKRKACSKSSLSRGLGTRLSTLRNLVCVL